MDEAMAEIERTLKPLDVDFDLKFYPGYPPMSVNPDHAWVTEVREAVQKGMGFFPRLSGAQGSLDQAYATEKTGIPTCVFGVGRQLESNIHGLNENVRVADLQGFARFLIELLSLKQTINESNIRSRNQEDGQDHTGGRTGGIAGQAR